MNLRTVPFVAGLTLSLAVGSIALAEPGDAASAAYTISLVRPAQVGDSAKYRAHYIASQVTVMTQKDKARSSTDAQYREVMCVIEEHVLKVSNGQIAQEQAALSEFQGRNSESAEMKPLDLAGATIEATLAPVASFRRTDGKQLSDEDLAYLNLVISASNTKSPTESYKIFAPHGPVKVGDKWEADHAALVANTSGVLLSENGITAPFTLTSQEKINGDTYLKVDGSVNADPITVPLPAGTKGTPLKGHMKITVSSTVAADPSKGMHNSNLDVSLAVKGAMGTDDSNIMDIAMTIKEHQDITVLEGVK